MVSNRLHSVVISKFYSIYSCLYEKYCFLYMALFASFNSFSQHHDIIYSPSNACPIGKKHLPLEDVQDNLTQLKNMLGRWQITQIGAGHVITGGGYEYEVKAGSAGNSFCVDGPKELVDVTYSNSNICPSSMIHLPKSLVEDELEQLKACWAIGKSLKLVVATSLLVVVMDMR